MKSAPHDSQILQFRRPASQFHPAKHAAFFGVLLLALGLNAQTNDNFDSGSDAAWSKITSPDYPATYSFVADGFGGKAYRLQGAAYLGTNFSANSARVVAYRAERLYTNFYTAVDIVSWNPSTDADQVFGLLARGTNINSGLVDAMVFGVRINRFQSSGGSRGQIFIYSFLGGDTGSPGVSGDCTLVPGHKYRFIFSGGLTNIFYGAIYDLEDLTRPLVSSTADDALANTGLAGPGFPTNTAGYVGIFNVSLGGSDPTTDTTFDNFIVQELTPTNLPAPATPNGLTGAPQVINRSPSSYSNFYPAALGISFKATTLTTTNPVNTNAIKLFLNGLDVSSGLSITGPTTNATVSYSGLTSNAVYNARIELQDALGRKTTNIWTFDTFQDAYLAGPHTKNIECEDFDYTSDINNVFIGNGSFIDDPLPSGYTTNDAANRTTRINGSDPVNNVYKGYVDLRGANGFDFFDYDGGVHNNEHDFRFFNSVGTQQGVLSLAYSDGNDPAILVYQRIYDTQRKKYSEVDPGLHEYVVQRTEGGEWLDYTRIFYNSNYYHAYLRYCSGLTQQVFLDTIGAGPATNRLGTFTVRTSCALGNYRYEPLLDDSGRMAVVNLSGTNVVRMTMALPQQNITKQETGFNYIAFVPALLVESAAQVTGPYSVETSASPDLGNRRITVPANGNTRFYRLRWDHRATIKSVALAGGNVILTYQ
jgi:hypothetical protein